MERFTTLYIDKESHKFSAAHYTIFSAEERERLHGHNYRVAVEIEAPLDPDGLVVDFIQVKPYIRAICDELDEPRPPSLAGLQPLLEDWSGIPAATLPKDLSAELRSISAP